MVVCNKAHRFMVAEQLSDIGVTPDTILLESATRKHGTGHRRRRPWEVLAQCDAGDRPLLLVMPTDRVIRDTEIIRAGGSGSHPETGYRLHPAGTPTGTSRRRPDCETALWRSQAPTKPPH